MYVCNSHLCMNTAGLLKIESSTSPIMTSLPASQPTIGATIRHRQFVTYTVMS
jgi:hypothetical protein